jgi:hypothetical protein
MQFKEIIVVYTVNFTKYMNTLRGGNTEFLDLKASGTQLPMGFEGLSE